MRLIDKGASWHISLYEAHCDGCVEEVREAKEGGGVADGDHQEGGEEGHQGLERKLLLKIRYRVV